MSTLALWLHVVCMVGTFGLVLGQQWVLPPAARDTPSITKRALAAGNALIAAGLVAGVVVYVITLQTARAAGTEVSSAYHLTIGIKFLLVFAVGACLGMGYPLLAQERYTALSGLRCVTLALLGLAAFLGLSAGT